MIRLLCILCVSAVHFVACGRAAFTDITDEVALDFVHHPGVEGNYFMPESLGSGAALFDYDNDGDLDIYLVQAGKRNPQDQLYRQEASGKFQNLTAQAGLKDDAYGMGAAAGDYDNDGDLDLYITNYGRDLLYRNNGDGTFTDVTDAAGIRNAKWGASAAFVDYDRDGFLDIYVVNYLQYDPSTPCKDKAGRAEYCGPSAFPGLADVLYHNNGDGTFEDVSEGAGISEPKLKGLGIVIIDWNQDAYPDIYVSNDGEPNHLWINQRDGTFRDQAASLGAAVNEMGRPEASMGVHSGDADGDLDFDLFITHLSAEKNTFYRNYGDAGFQDESSASGLAAPSIPYTGFGTAFFDCDHDMDLDIAVVNGRIARGEPHRNSESPDYWKPYSEPNLLFVNDGTGKFQEEMRQCGDFCAHVQTSRALAVGDLDNDGDLDLIATNAGEGPRIYRNNATGNWLMVRAVDPTLKRDAIGAVVTLQANGKQMVRQVGPAYSYLSSNDFRVHFGLGDASKIDRLQVRWPDGSIQQFQDISPNAVITVNKKR